MSDPLSSQIVQRERRERERDRTRRKIAFPDLSVKIYKDCTENTTCECIAAALRLLLGQGSVQFSRIRHYKKDDFTVYFEMWQL